MEDAGEEVADEKAMERVHMSPEPRDPFSIRDVTLSCARVATFFHSEQMSSALLGQNSIEIAGSKITTWNWASRLPGDLVFLEQGAFIRFEPIADEQSVIVDGPFSRHVKALDCFSNRKTSRYGNVSLEASFFSLLDAWSEIMLDRPAYKLLPHRAVANKPMCPTAVLVCPASDRRFDRLGDASFDANDPSFTVSTPFQFISGQRHHTYQNPELLFWVGSDPDLGSIRLLPAEVVLRRVNHGSSPCLASVGLPDTKTMAGRFDVDCRFASHDADVRDHQYAMALRLAKARRGTLFERICAQLLKDGFDFERDMPIADIQYRFRQLVSEDTRDIPALEAMLFPAVATGVEPSAADSTLTVAEMPVDFEADLTPAYKRLKFEPDVLGSVASPGIVWPQGHVSRLEGSEDDDDDFDLSFLLPSLESIDEAQFVPFKRSISDGVLPIGETSVDFGDADPFPQHEFPDAHLVSGRMEWEKPLIAIQKYFRATGANLIGTDAIEIIFPDGRLSTVGRLPRRVANRRATYVESRIEFATNERNTTVFPDESSYLDEHLGPGICVSAKDGTQFTCGVLVTDKKGARWVTLPLHGFYKAGSKRVYHPPGGRIIGEVDLGTVDLASDLILMRPRVEFRFQNSIFGQKFTNATPREPRHGDTVLWDSYLHGRRIGQVAHMASGMRPVLKSIRTKDGQICTKVSYHWIYHVIPNDRIWKEVLGACGSIGTYQNGDRKHEIFGQFVAGERRPDVIQGIMWFLRPSGFANTLEGTVLDICRSGNLPK